jgi:hypothetical protein
MKCHIKFIALGTIILLCLAGCETLGEYDIRGEWDSIITDNVLGQIISAIANFQGSKESGIVVNNSPVPDPYSQSNPSTYTVQGNHIIITRPGLPSAFCTDCGNYFEGNFNGADTVSGTWFDYRQPPHSGTWTMTRR